MPAGQQGTAADVCARACSAGAGPQAASIDIGRSSELPAPAAPKLYFLIMSAAPDDPSREARTRIADAIVTAAERGDTLTADKRQAD